MYAYIVSCGCFERRTIDDVLYHDDAVCPHEVVQQPPAPVPDPVSGQQPVASEGKDNSDDSAAKVPQATTPNDDSDIPLKTAPIKLEDGQSTGGEEDDVVSALRP